MKTPPPNDPPHEFDNEFDLPLNEKDALWELLEQAPQSEASPLFSRNVLRKIRLDEQSKPSLWQAITSYRYALAGGLAALTALVVIPLTLSPQNPENTSMAALVSEPSAATATTTALVKYLDEELLLAAADEPSLFSDDEVIAMLF